MRVRPGEPAPILEAMACPEDAVIMNYSLGRLLEGPLRLHIAGCKRCRTRLIALEKSLLEEGIELRGQASAGFGIQKTSAPARSN